jgi:glycosyltransferase involved in cell wall biosynthesis
VASTADAASEVVVDGETGLLVPFDDPEATATAILTLLQDDALARRMGEAARRRAGERFTPDALRERLGTVLGLGDAG